MILRLAWRNIWRNRGRTLITVSSILLAVLLAVLFQSIAIGTYDRLIENIVSFYTGYVQVHRKGFQEDRSLENTFKLDRSLSRLLDENPGVASSVPRLESFALASSGKYTKGTLVVGIVPDRENRLTNIEQKIVQGRYLDADDHGALLAEGLASYLKLDTLNGSDTLVMISQGYRGVNAAAKYPVIGLVKFPSPDLNNQLVFLPIQSARQFYGADSLLTSLVLIPRDADKLHQLIRRFKSEADLERYEILDWKEMMPELMQQMELDRAGDFIFTMILYIIIAFGVFGTVLMMTSERMYEFGVLEAIGMQKSKLGLLVWTEVMLLALLGVLSGILVSLPIVIYFFFNPIELGGEFAKVYEQYGFEAVLAFSMAPVVFLKQAFIVFCIVSVIALYPLFIVGKLRVVPAMRH